MTASEVLLKHEDANEYHFHEVDRKWIIEAMEEYAASKRKQILERRDGYRAELEVVQDKIAIAQEKHNRSASSFGVNANSKEVEHWTNMAWDLRQRIEELQWLLK